MIRAAIAKAIGIAPLFSKEFGNGATTVSEDS